MTVQSNRQGLIDTDDPPTYILRPVEEADKVWPYGRRNLQEDWVIEQVQKDGPERLGWWRNINDDSFIMDCESTGSPFNFHMDVVEQKFTMTRMYKGARPDGVFIYAGGGNCSRM